MPLHLRMERVPVDPEELRGLALVARSGGRTWGPPRHEQDYGALVEEARTTFPRARYQPDPAGELTGI